MSSVPGHMIATMAAADASTADTIVGFCVWVFVVGRINAVNRRNKKQSREKEEALTDQLIREEILRARIERGEE